MTDKTIDAPAQPDAGEWRSDKDGFIWRSTTSIAKAYDKYSAQAICDEHNAALAAARSDTAPPSSLNNFGTYLEYSAATYEAKRTVEFHKALVEAARVEADKAATERAKALLSQNYLEFFADSSECVLPMNTTNLPDHAICSIVADLNDADLDLTKEILRDAEPITKAGGLLFITVWSYEPGDPDTCNAPYWEYSGVSSELTDLLCSRNQGGA